MKKLASLGLIATLAFGVAACEKADPAADFKKFQEWNLAQQKIQTTAQMELQQKLAAVTDPAKEVAPILESYAAKVQESVKSLDAIDVKSEEIKTFKAKAKEVLALSSEVLVDSAKVASAPTPELQKTVQEKVQKLQTISAELQKTEAELTKKYVPAPAAK